jgi:hypothetical protein
MERMKLDPASLRVESFETPAPQAPEQMRPTTTVQTIYRTCTCPV